ncbi:hypothetical protein ACNKHP_18345 [Shigella boydii]
MVKIDGEIQQKPFIGLIQPTYRHLRHEQSLDANKFFGAVQLVDTGVKPAGIQTERRCPSMMGNSGALTSE